MVPSPSSDARRLKFVDSGWLEGRGGRAASTNRRSHEGQGPMVRQALRFHGKFSCVGHGKRGSQGTGTILEGPRGRGRPRSIPREAGQGLVGWQAPAQKLGKSRTGNPARHRRRDESSGRVLSGGRARGFRAKPSAPGKRDEGASNSGKGDQREGRGRGKASGRRPAGATGQDGAPRRESQNPGRVRPACRVPYRRAGQAGERARW